MKNSFKMILLTIIICILSACDIPNKTESLTPQKVFPDGSVVKYYYNQQNVIDRIDFESIHEKKSVTYYFDSSLEVEYRNIILDNRTTTGKISVGKLIRTDVNINDEVIYTSYMEYNSDGKMEKCEFYSSNGGILSYWLFESELEKNCIKQNHYNAEDELIGWLITLKDDNGEVL